MPCTILLTLSGGSKVLIVEEGQRWRMMSCQNGFINPFASSAYYVDWESFVMGSNIRIDKYPIENGEVNFAAQPVRINSGRPAIEYAMIRPS